MDNQFFVKLTGRYALFTDPLTRSGGEKCSYQIPTYEALKGALKSIYWKPTLIWVIDEVKVIKPIQTQTKGTKPINYGGGNSLAIYTFLHDVEYHIKAHFEWNQHRPELAKDRISGKHYSIAKRMLERGGRQDIFLGARDCQGYVEPLTEQEYNDTQFNYPLLPELGFGRMFHSYGYPDETGDDKLIERYWLPKLKQGVVKFIRPEDCTDTRVVRQMKAKQFDPGVNFKPVEAEQVEHVEEAEL